MIFKYGRFLIIFLVLSLLAPTAKASDWYVVHGEIKQVFLEQRKVLVANEETKFILVLEPHCQIFRAGSPVSLQSLRPITPTDLQDALFWVNPQGLVSYLLVNYKVFEENGILQAYNIFGEAK